MSGYARLEVLCIAIIGAALTVAVACFFGYWALVPAILALGLSSFYRDPPRRPPQADDLILAPADGKVVEVARGVVGPDGRRILRIMIFLSIFDVHINRSPCAGRVKEVNYRPGRFINALRAEADLSNESNTLLIEPAPPLPGPVLVRQIAGVLARRIVCAVRAGDQLAAGQRFGMIKLGSRTELCLPEDPRWELRVTVGRRVQAGLTVLARLGDVSAG